MNGKKQKVLLSGLIILFAVVVLGFFYGAILTYIGEFLIFDEKPTFSDAVVVLNTGMEYYPRLMEASVLYKQGFAFRVVINGNRKTDALRNLEKKGFRPCCPWYEGRTRILELLGVPREDVIPISIEDAYDTVSEAVGVGKALMEAGVESIIITTSKSHTRRARHIWKNLYPETLKIHTVAARMDPYTPEGWWREGRQIKWVLAEYGAWLYYFWKKEKW